MPTDSGEKRFCQRGIVRETNNRKDYRGIVIVVLLWVFMVVVAGTWLVDHLVRG